MTFKKLYGDHSNEVYKGILYISYDRLTSLEGCYKEVHGDFYCSHNELESLEYAPKIVNGNFDCRYNVKLKSLEELLETKIKGKIISDLDIEDFNKKKALYKKLGKKKYKQYMYLAQEI